jgi:hypothetical protein
MSDGDLFITAVLVIVTVGSVLWIWSFDTLVHKIRSKRK